ncbi:MAG: amidohydrolase [Bacteroidales bacterium]|nr:amidohydrolase [Bacteroidales bacterium]
MKSLTEIRHILHRLAEPSGEEVRTQKQILEILEELHPSDIHTFDNGYSILAVYDSKQPGPTLLFRGDFDAVRVDETIDVPYASLTAGISHKCGHDGHATILLGLAEQLHLEPVKRGRILLFFQAAEETGEGAGQLLSTCILDEYKPNKVFALHNIPGEPLGTVICKKDSFTCSVISCDIELHGHTSHASEPLKAVCPYAAARDITDRVLSLNRYDMSAADYCLFTLVEFRVGEPAYGVTAGHGVLRFTLRAKDDDVLQQAKREVVATVERAAAAHSGIGYNVAWKEYFAASKNQEAAVNQVKSAAAACGLPYVEKEFPFSWGEDFGLLTQHYDGALFGIGSGVQQPSLHHQNFDFPDELLPIAVRLFQCVIDNA